MAITPSNILVVDDDPGMLRLLAKWLVGLGYSVRTAEDGRRAIELMQLECPDVLLTDWEMPYVNGLDLINWLRARPLAQYVYSIVLTIRCGKADIESLFAAGVDDYLRKPIDKDELVARLLCGQRRLQWLETARANAGLAPRSFAPATTWESVSDRFERLTAADLLEPSALLLGADESLHAAALRVLSCPAGQWPVVHTDGRFVGLLHEPDLLAALLQQRAWDKPLRLFVRQGETTFAPHNAALEVYGHFCRHAVECVPVLRDGKLLGMIRRRQLLEHLAAPAAPQPLVGGATIPSLSPLPAAAEVAAL
jgi:CheY-like chemotaxis protein